MRRCNAYTKKGGRPQCTRWVEGGLYCSQHKRMEPLQMWQLEQRMAQQQELERRDLLRQEARRVAACAQRQRQRQRQWRAAIKIQSIFRGHSVRSLAVEAARQEKLLLQKLEEEKQWREERSQEILRLYWDLNIDLRESRFQDLVNVHAATVAE